MKKSKKIILSIIILVLIGIIAIFFIKHKPSGTKAENQTPVARENNSVPNPQPQAEETKKPPEINLVGPRVNVPKDAPNDYGFWSFAVVETGILSRSGQPTLKDFQWLKDNGWKSDIDLRIDNDHNEPSDDAQIPGFEELGFNYLRIQMVDGAAPTKDQVEQFLNFVTNPENQPAHVHCRGGIGRAGIMVALYRYSVNGWPVDKILEESKLFQGGIDEAQQKFLNNWAENNAPGSWGK